MNHFAFDLVTPQATFFSGDVRMVEAPGTLGDFGVLAGHMPFVSTLRAGVVTVHGTTEAEPAKLFVAGGIAEVNPSSCTILAEQVVELAGLTHADAEARLDKARQAADNAFDDNAKAAAAKELAVAEALLAAVN